MDQLLVDREKFTILMSQIIQSEFSPAQQQIFRFEGPRMINKLFDQKCPDLETSRQMFREEAFHLNEFNEVAKLSIDFITMMVACFTFYLDYSRAKSEEKKAHGEEEAQLPPSLEAKEKRIELIHELKMEMENQSMPKDVIDKITEKYQKELIDLAEEL